VSSYLVTELVGEEVWLLPEKALYWPGRRTLLVADTHFGKAATFRSAAIPVPRGTTDDNLVRLSRALQKTAAQRLVCLGDLLHAKTGRIPEMVAAVAAWRAQWAALEIVLVKGNHDQHAGEPPPEWEMVCMDEPLLDRPFALRHFPEAEADYYTLAGHVHPAVNLKGRGGLQAQLPCFYFGKEVGILPAFGGFTGTAVVRPRRGEKVFVIAETEVVQMS
jgi:DNA ligase-associated metallophosphoesterase